VNGVFSFPSALIKLPINAASESQLDKSYIGTKYYEYNNLRNL